MIQKIYLVHIIVHCQYVPSVLIFPPSNIHRYLGYIHGSLDSNRCYCPSCHPNVIMFPVSPSNIPMYPNTTVRFDASNMILHINSNASYISCTFWRSYTGWPPGGKNSYKKNWKSLSVFIILYYHLYYYSLMYVLVKQIIIEN